MGVVPFKATGTAPESTEWNWDAAAQNKVLGDTDNPNWERYRDAHTWYNSSDNEKKSAYSLPHHRMGDSGLEAVWHGVTAAVARLEQSDIPEADMKGCFDHLAKHYAQWDKEPPEWDRFVAGVRERRARQMKAQRSGIALPDFVATRAPMIVSSDRQNGVPTADDMTYIQRQTRNPNIPAEQFYVLATESSNSGIDAYYTVMSPQTLAWYAEDATRGVAFCDSHTHWELPIGRTFYGATASRALEPGDAVPAAGDGANMPRALTTGELLTAQLLTYMLRDLPLSDGLNTNDLIRGIDAGIYQDISVGFKPLAYWCNICGCDMLRDWDCMHWPGQTYEVKDPNSDQTRQVLCIAVIDARLAEHSLVYDGATPNAMTLKAQRALESGRALSQQETRNIRLVEDHCRVKLVERWQGFGNGFALSAAAAASGRSTTSAPAAAAAAAAAQPNGRIPARNQPRITVISNEEADTMRGSEFVARFMQVAQEEATRAGKKMSATDLSSLQSIHDNLRAGHDDMDGALRDLAAFMNTQNAAESDTAPAGNTDSASNPGAGDGQTAVGDLPDANAAAASTPFATGETRASDGVVVRADGSHDAMTGSHSHSHAAFGSQGDDGSHTHSHTHDGDANHNHAHTDNAAPATSGGGSSHTHGPESLSPEQRAIYEAGERYIKAVRDDAVGWAVRAGVATTPEDEQKWRGILARFTPDEIETMSAEWARQAGERFSPRGRFTPNARKSGGGTWSSEPTQEGGARQTQASDPNNPLRLAANRGSSAAAAAVVGPATKDDARLYSLSGGKSKASGGSKGR